MDLIEFELTVLHNDTCAITTNNNMLYFSSQGPIWSDELDEPFLTQKPHTTVLLIRCIKNKQEKKR